MRLVLVLMWLLHWLPLPVLGRMGEGLGNLLFFVIRKRRHITLTNLRLCLPERSEEERRQIARRHFQLYARSVLERGVLWWASETRLKKLIQVEPAVPLALIQSGPTILLCPHFVCLDVAGVAVMLESSLCSIYTEQRNKVFDQALRQGRSRFRPVKLFSRAEGVKPIIRAMQEKLPYFMLPDMDFGAKNAEFIPFFGVPAATLTAMPRLAASTQAKVVPVIATMLPDYRGWKVCFHAPWEHYPGDDITAATRQMNAFIEQEVLKAPAEYFWAHKRFKTRPPGEPGVY
ncbi:LpxL/LpxP family acyltransferase [Undibacterium oligocarboniphilum]|uniref:Lipid A biosynthesis acyltransferase n=1 Tax=Undibacterium oligocarboniphilum TaxID=666702 RepID=A0A850QE12_9BURK|nr:lipid A biosynthesis acyltransferase [Undibacterium oligocarboniphilum]MBC3870507.1 lipid A biosynthesis acyltransferase [Undibacterium oligocarboniphilum]NVO78692.1 lipid A biosynthesis acyltransferase [Undibacterium oligocarboniphilum]